MRRLSQTLAAALAAALLLAPAAPAAQAPTRDEYVERLEEICKPDNEATQRVMKGARADIRAERLAVAAAKFARATRIFGGSVRGMEAVPEPPADRPKLGRWFGHLHDQEGYLRGVTAQLRADRPVKAQRQIARFIHAGNLANSVILPFGFEACTFKFSRYG
ncbi:MAG TPA: hypothetical protein VK889_01385 [Solirubrobacterales bacterium]|nr:hypothetical protein [Solirubrobacterales bacterium]